MDNSLIGNDTNTGLIGGEDPVNPRMVTKKKKPVASSNFLSHPFGTNTLIGDLSEPEKKEPEIKIVDAKGLKTGSYSKAHIDGIIKASRIVGIDPRSAIALALQESNLGKAKTKGRRGVRDAELAQVNQFSESQQKELDKKAAETGVGADYLKLAIALRDKMKYAEVLGFQDEASKLQAYNGYGMITKDKFGGTDKAYGVSIGSGIDMKKNPLYGKRLLELKKDISQNEEINNLISQELLAKK